MQDESQNDDVWVIHFVIGLGKGGAETMLVNILRNQSEQASSRHTEVVSMGITEHYEKDIVSLGIPLHVFNLRKKPIASMWRARRLLRRASTVSSWLYLGNLLAWFLTLGTRSRLVWNIRHADLGRPHNKITTITAAKLGGLLANRVSVIAYNGDRSRLLHEALGYPPSKSTTLQNGCDLDRYKRISDAGVRAALDVKKDQSMVLSAARWHPLKDHQTFLRAFALVSIERPDAIAVMCGEGIVYENLELNEILKRLDLVGKVRLLGLRHDLPELFSETDLYVLHSKGEAFPNTLIEAMACGARVVATDVGEVSQILPPRSAVVEPDDPAAMAEAIKAELKRPPHRVAAEKAANIQRVRESYSIKRVVLCYEEVLGL